MAVRSLDYGGLPTSFDYVRVYDPNQSEPIEGSNPELRDPKNGSPFAIEILLPEILLESFQGKRVIAPEGIFDPFLEEANAAAALAGDNQLGTRVPQNITIGFVASALRSTNNFKALLNKQNSFKGTTFIATSPSALTNLEKVIYGDGYTSNPSNTLVTTANQVALTDLNQALSVILQTNRILRTPRLEFLINPTTWSITYVKKQEWQEANRYGFVFQAWGEEQAKISCSGRIGAFYAGSYTGQSDSISGVQWASRRDSAAFQFLMNLLTFYQTNGYIYDLIGASHNTTWVGDIMIFYDQKVYLGSFENFSFSYEEGQQVGGITYNFNFLVSREFDLQTPGPIGLVGQPKTSPGVNPILNNASGTAEPQVSAEESIFDLL